MTSAPLAALAAPSLDNLLNTLCKLTSCTESHSHHDHPTHTQTDASSCEWDARDTQHSDTGNQLMLMKQRGLWCLGLRSTSTDNTTNHFMALGAGRGPAATNRAGIWTNCWIYWTNNMSSITLYSIFNRAQSLRFYLPRLHWLNYFLSRC